MRFLLIAILAIVAIGQADGSCCCGCCCPCPCCCSKPIVIKLPPPPTKIVPCCCCCKPCCCCCKPCCCCCPCCCPCCCGGRRKRALASAAARGALGNAALVPRVNEPRRSARCAGCEGCSETVKPTEKKSKKSLRKILNPLVVDRQLDACGMDACQPCVPGACADCQIGCVAAPRMVENLEAPYIQHLVAPAPLSDCNPCFIGHQPLKKLKRQRRSVVAILREKMAEKRLIFKSKAARPGGFLFDLF